jgi:integrase
MERAKGFEPSIRISLGESRFPAENRYGTTRLTRADVVTNVVTTIAMASIKKHPKSPFWMACFTLPDGRRTTRSTGTINKKEAQRVANHFEDAANEGKARRLTESRARKTIADIFALANPDTLASSSISDFLSAWLKRKELEAGDKTHSRYETVVDQLNRYLGARANQDITHLNAREIAGFREHLTQRVSAGTVNEWRGMILFGIYSGLRLGDIATLTWRNIDLQAAELSLTTAKTGREQILPLAKPLLKHLENLPVGDDPEAPLFPDAFAAKQRSHYGGTLSNQFYEILVKANLAIARPHQNTGKGRSGKRAPSVLSFHSLRHTATSMLKNAGISDSVAKDIIGHESAAVSANYTHIDRETKRQALDKLPDLLG